MRLEDMTNHEVVRDFDNRKVLTENEAVLADRLRSALEEIEDLEREINRLLDEDTPGVQRDT